VKEYKFIKSQLNKAIDEAVHSAAEGGKEICGLLLDNGYFIEIIQVKNKVKRGGGFAFYSKEIRNIQASAERLGHTIIGTFHSHPYYIAAPGDSDIRNTVNDSLMLIIDVLKKKAGLWHIKDKEKVKLKISLLK
jgi:proteasome lid subunit RPN8/RPN11